jgi:Tfp pilus assembly protein PilV
MIRTRETGSIVIEAMVAALIVAALAAALLQVVAGRAAAARRLGDQRDALMVAQSRLSALDLRAAAVPGSAAGRDGRFTWTMRAIPFHGDEASTAGTLAFVTVGVGRSTVPRPLVVLHTLRLVR